MRNIVSDATLARRPNMAHYRSHQLLRSRVLVQQIAGIHCPTRMDQGVSVFQIHGVRQQNCNFREVTPCMTILGGLFAWFRVSGAGQVFLCHILFFSDLDLGYNLLRIFYDPLVEMFSLI